MLQQLLYSYSLTENNFLYYEDEFGGLKLPVPNLLGNFQFANIATAIATLRNIDEININESHIKKGIKKVVTYNLFIVVILNLLLTPIFHLLTFDVPTRQPNYSITKKYDSDFFKGMFSGIHFITAILLIRLPRLILDCC